MRDDDLVDTWCARAQPVNWPGPPSLGLRLWSVDLDQGPSAGDLTDPLLSHRERDRAARFVFERDARRYRHAHAVLNALLGRLTGSAPHALPWAENRHGKPRLPGARWCFNLSHSAGRGFIGVMPLPHDGLELGVDVECLKPMDDLEDMARHHFSPTEFTAWRGEPAAERLGAFYRCWTRKEACLKAIGSGLSVAPDVFEAGIHGHPVDTRIAFEGGHWPVRVWSLPRQDGIERAVALAWRPGSPAASPTEIP